MKTRISKKKLHSFINEHCYVSASTIMNDDGSIYLTKVGNNYFTRVGMEESVKWLLKMGITEELSSYGDGTVCLGFNPTEQKWYGWSHRAVYGFGIGSKVKIGNCSYLPSNKDEFMNSMLLWYSDEMYKNVKLTHSDTGIDIYYEIHPRNNGKHLIYNCIEPYPNEWGRGEWEAKTLEDARQMAIDFAKGVN